MDLLALTTTGPKVGRTVLGLALATNAKRRGVSVLYGLDPASTSDDVSLAVELLGEPSVASAGGASRVTDPDLVITEIPIDGAPTVDAQVVSIVWYYEEMNADDVMNAAGLERGLSAVVINNVPKLRMHAVQSELAPALSVAGARVLGVIPQDRVLLSPTARDIVEFLGAEVIAFPDGLDEPAENVMLGALALDGGIHYYGGTDRKVVITRFDRPDLQMPALETGCQALILTNGGQPIPYVWNRVQELQVPVALVQSGTIATAQELSKGFLAQRTAPTRRKVERMIGLLDDAAPELLELTRQRGTHG